MLLINYSNINDNNFNDISTQNTEIERWKKSS